ncbi:MAG: hypothetical protein H0W74_07095 [Sphingosinicella sp.]|nr:hypothetical protein [Sphingosinicella sp.]
MKAIMMAALLLAAPVAGLAQSAAPRNNAEGSSGLSAAGATLFRDYQAEQRVALGPLMKQRGELQAQFDALMSPRAYDDSKLAATMAALRQVEGQIVERQGNALLALLRAMTPADRTAFLAAMSKSPPNAASRPPAPRAGPGR